MNKGLVVGVKRGLKRSTYESESAAHDADSSSLAKKRTLEGQQQQVAHRPIIEFNPGSASEPAAAHKAISVAWTRNSSEFSNWQAEEYAFVEGLQSLLQQHPQGVTHKQMKRSGWSIPERVLRGRGLGVEQWLRHHQATSPPSWTITGIGASSSTSASAAGASTMLLLPLSSAAATSAQAPAGAPGRASGASLAATAIAATSAVSAAAPAAGAGAGSTHAFASTSAGAIAGVRRRATCASAGASAAAAAPSSPSRAAGSSRTAAKAAAMSPPPLHSAGPTTAAAAVAAAAAGSSSSTAICWQSIFALQGVTTSPSPEGDARLAAQCTSASPPGLSHLGLGPFDVLLAQSLPAAEFAVQALLAAMRAGGHAMMGFDMEWRPEFHRGQNNRVAMVQLSAGRLCVLLRTCTFGFKLPQALLRDVFDDPNISLLACGFDSCDKMKMQRTFGLQPAHLRCQVVDLQVLAKARGHRKVGIKGMAQALLHASFKKSKSLSMTNWEAGHLSASALRYAALDAICAEHIYYALLSAPA